MTLGEFLERGRYSQLLPRSLPAAADRRRLVVRAGQIREFPARYLVRFFANHGMLTVKHAPAWKTVTGGSRRVRAGGGRRARATP